MMPAITNAAYSFSTGLAEIIPILGIPIVLTDMVILTKNQLFMVDKLGLAFGFSTRWQDYVAEFGSVLGSGFVFRQIARSLVGLIPLWGIAPKPAIVYAGTDVVAYTGDAYHEDWPETLDRLLELKPEKLVPGRGDALHTATLSRAAIEGTREFLLAMYTSVRQGRAAGKSLSECYVETYRKLAPEYGNWVIFEHCLPFDITRCYDEAGHPDPRIWTAQRDTEVWHSLQGALETLER